MMATTANGNSGTEEVGVDVETDGVVEMDVEVTSEVVMPVRWEDEVLSVEVVVVDEMVRLEVVEVAEDEVLVVTDELDQVKVVRPNITEPYPPHVALTV